MYGALFCSRGRWSLGVWVEPASTLLLASERLRRREADDLFLASAGCTRSRKRSIVFSCSSVGQVPFSFQYSTRASVTDFHLAAAADVCARLGNGSSEWSAGENSSSFRGRFDVFASGTESDGVWVGSAPWRRRLPHLCCDDVERELGRNVVVLLMLRRYICALRVSDERTVVKIAPIYDNEHAVFCHFQVWSGWGPLVVPHILDHVTTLTRRARANS